MKTAQQSENTGKENFKIFNKVNIEEILNNIYIKNSPGKIIVTGGHYGIFPDDKVLREETNPGTVKSLEFAKEIQSKLKSENIEADLGILINDMGTSCDENICNISPLKFLRDEYKLPPAYNNVLNNSCEPLQYMSGYKKNEGDIKIFWEKNIRNQAKKIFTKILKTGSNFKNKNIIIKNDQNGFFIEDLEKYGKIILTRTRGKDKYGTPACPLIMTGFNIYLWKLKYSTCINFYYIGQDNIFNVPNYFVIEKGKRLTELFGCDIDITNIYLDKIL